MSSTEYTVRRTTIRRPLPGGARTITAWGVYSPAGSLIGTQRDRETAEGMARRLTARGPRPEPTPAPARDASADYVSRLAGLPYAPATGRCHYCGGPLDTAGYCDECR